jgi:hypothetical protein
VKYRFIGIQASGGGEHDPGPELLQRVRKLSFRPFSAEWTRKDDGELLFEEKTSQLVAYIIVYIDIKSEDEAEVGVDEWPTLNGGGQRFTYQLHRRGGKWAIKKETPGPMVS